MCSSDLTIGRFITTDTAALDKAREALRRETVDRLLEEAKSVGLEPDQLVEAIRTRLQELKERQDTQDTDTKGVNSL